MHAKLPTVLCCAACRGPGVVVAVVQALAADVRGGGGEEVTTSNRGGVIIAGDARGQGECGDVVVQ